MGRRTRLKNIYICFLKKHKTILACLFSFCLGCGLSIKFMRAEIEDYPRFNEYLSKDSRAVSNNNITEYAVLILTALDNIDRRVAIRRTWKKFVNNFEIIGNNRVHKWNPRRFSEENSQQFIKFYFVIGVKGLDQSAIHNLHEERRKYNDIVILDNYVDQYSTLALKMLYSIRWISANLENVKYVIKCDDDSFMRIDLIVKELEEFAPNMNSPLLYNFVSYKRQKNPIRGLYWGYFDGRARIVTKGKWQENKWFLCNHYLPYALGGGYVLSRDIVDYIARNSNFLSTYNSEDVSMGVWTAALDGINRVHDIRFDTEWKTRGCNDYMLVKHKQDPEDMFGLFMELMQSQGEKLCTNFVYPEILHREYMYNWNLLPNSCCGRRR